VHTINLVTKAILRLFDIQRKNDIHDFNDVAHALAEPVDDEEECTEDQRKDEEQDEEDEGEENDLSFAPIRSTLMKVCLHFIYIPK